MNIFFNMLFLIIVNTTFKESSKLNFIMNQTSSFLIRLLFFVILYWLSSSLLLSVTIFLIIDLFVIPQLLLNLFGYHSEVNGLDYLFHYLVVNNCFYVTLDRPMTDFKSLKSQMKRHANGLDRFLCYVDCFLGKYYMKKIEKERMQTEFDRAFIEIDEEMIDKN